MDNYRSADRGMALAITTMLLLGFSPLSEAQTAPITIEVSQPDAPVTLEMGILSANMVIVGEQRPDVQLEVNGGASSRRIVTPSGSQEIPASSYRLSVREESNVVKVSSEWRMSTLDVVVRVPRATALNLWTTNDGTIKVDGVTGEMQLQNTNGPISVTGAAASVIAESVNDDIAVSFSDPTSASASSLSSVNGDLMIGLPSRAQAQVHLDTARGEIQSDFEIDVQPSEPKISRSEGSGTIEIDVETMVIANINGGGPVIRMKTLNGDIAINRAE